MVVVHVVVVFEQEFKCGIGLKLGMRRARIWQGKKSLKFVDDILNIPESHLLI
jgi:hypothetical protein